MTGNYVDDYPMVAPSETADAMVRMACEALSLLGWEVKKPDQLKPHNTFTALGTVITLPSSLSWHITVSNREDRLSQDRDHCTQILKKGVCRPSEIRKLRGRLQFASAQSTGRCGAWASPCLRSLAEGKGGPRPLSELEALAVDWWRCYLTTHRPRVVAMGRSRPPLVAYTDGAVEDVTTVGGALFDKSSGFASAFGEVVPEEVVRSWAGKLGQSQVIGQAEIAPTILALLAWKEKCVGRDLLLFIDNESAAGALLRGYSPNLASARLISRFWMESAKLGVRVWIEWVAGPSNVADGPSRLDFTLVEELGCRRVRTTDWGSVSGRGDAGGVSGDLLPTCVNDRHV